MEPITVAVNGIPEHPEYMDGDDEELPLHVHVQKEDRPIQMHDVTELVDQIENTEINGDNEEVPGSC